jgi:hypothetical protein
MRNLLTRCFGALLACAGSQAHAAWYEARSKHFIIYADENPKQLADFATRLERFDQAVRYATRTPDGVVGDGNRLTVFVLPSAKEVRSIMGDKTGWYSGFYKGRVEGSVAYVPKESSDPDQLDRGAIFFHEYTHHLMRQDLSAPYPEWYVEGFAEFFSTPKFEKDGSVWLGRIVAGRAYGLFMGPQLQVDNLFRGMQPGMSNEHRDVFYGRSWLLTHYLLLDSHRKGQLTAYVAALSSGASSLDAARRVFGDLGQLDKELNAYRDKRLLEFRVPADQIRVQAVTLSPLSAGASQVMPARARIKNDMSLSAAEPVAAQVRAIEARFPGDELVEATLAEAELVAGHPQAAEAAADRALKANPRNTEAMVFKAQAIAEQADGVQDEAARRAMFQEARRRLIAANKIDTEDPEPLFAFYRTYLREGIRPNENALAALHYASDLAPQDLGVRMNSAVAYLNEGKPKEARATLTVVAYSPHVEEMGDVARRMITDIDAGNVKAALEELGRAPRQASSSR